MRDVLSRLLVEAAASDERFLVLSGDHGYALFDPLRAAYSDRFVNVGVAEQNMIGMAAGLAKVGYRPCVYGLAAFVPMRVLEQIKLDLCHAHLPVILLGDGAGLVYSTLGVSHQCGEDIACLRPLPGITIYSPCDEFELAACWQEARGMDHPSYIRLGKADRPRVHAGPLTGTEPVWTNAVAAGKPAPLIVATGSMASPATAYARERGVACLSVPRIKPLPQAIVAAVQASSRAIVAEEHVAAGGLFGAVAEALVAGGKAGAGVPVHHLGLESRFTETAGSYENALSEHDLNSASLSRRLADWLAAT
jgi:transketolase